MLTPSKKILLVHPTGDDRKQAWSLPKGHKDVGETESQACLRELYEETGLDLRSKLSFLENLGGFGYTKDKRYHLFLLKHDREIDPHTLHCASMFKNHEGVETREIDGFAMLPFNNALSVMSFKQGLIVKQFKEKLT